MHEISTEFESIHCGWLDGAAMVDALLSERGHLAVLSHSATSRSTWRAAGEFLSIAELAGVPAHLRDAYYGAFVSAACMRTAEIVAAYRP